MGRASGPRQREKEPSMRFHLLTVAGAERDGATWRIAPPVALRSLMERGPALMVPLPGAEVELRTPEGRVITAHVASFGIDAWQDSAGNLYISSSPADPLLTLTLTCGAEVAALPPGTEVWLPSARPTAAPEDA
jgi:hypothetical protein